MPEQSTEHLRYLQSMPLDIKVALTKARIHDAVRNFGAADALYVSFSGGKDSTVLLHIARQMYNFEAIYCDTGLEYPEIKKFVREFDNVRIVRPKLSFKDVVTQYGYPVLSKDISHKVEYARKGSDWALKFVSGTYHLKDGRKSKYNISKYKELVNVDFKISDQCCGVMKKKAYAQARQNTYYCFHV